METGHLYLGSLAAPSGLYDQEASKAHPLTLHFIVSIAWGPGVVKLRSLTKLCGLQVSVETDIALKGPLQYKCCQRFGHTSGTAVTHRGVLLVVRLPSQGSLYLKAATSVLQLWRKYHSQLPRVCEV